MKEKGRFAVREEVQRWLVLDRVPRHLFDPTLARDMKEYVDKCFDIADTPKVGRTPEEQETVERLLSEISAQGRKIAEELEERLLVN